MRPARIPRAQRPGRGGGGRDTPRGGGRGVVVDVNGGALFGIVNDMGVLRAIASPDPAIGGDDEIVVGEGDDVVIAGVGTDYVNYTPVAGIRI